MVELKSRPAGDDLAIVIDETDLLPFIYYAVQPLTYDMVGIAMTNAGRQVVPTFGSEARFGTNPICFAAPAPKGASFCH